ncbi:MAG: RloB family protein, partial [Campylobacterota bacterium]|nr:RloB family protein [Campylobacterota bacterium]
MTLTSRRKRPIDRRSKPTPNRDASLFIIATEGRKTEKQYFSMFGNRGCQVKVITNEDNKSAPAHILEQLKRFKKEYQLKEDDELWLMVDVDRWGDKNLATVVSQAGQKKFQLAVSNPCFEVWLYLHHDDLDHQPINARQMKQKLKNLLGGYNSSNLDPTKFTEHIEDAITRAKALDTNREERWPSKTGTHVYKVVENIK